MDLAPARRVGISPLPGSRASILKPREASQGAKQTRTLPGGGRRTDLLSIRLRGRKAPAGPVQRRVKLRYASLAYTMTAYLLRQVKEVQG